MEVSDKPIGELEVGDVVAVIIHERWKTYFRLEKVSRITPLLAIIRNEGYYRVNPPKSRRDRTGECRGDSDRWILTGEAARKEIAAIVRLKKKIDAENIWAERLEAAAARLSQADVEAVRTACDEAETALRETELWREATG